MSSDNKSTNSSWLPTNLIFGESQEKASDQTNDSDATRRKDATLLYPSTRRDEENYTMYSDYRVHEPYSYLEDSFREDTSIFVQSQKELFEWYMKGSENRKAIREELQKFLNYPRSGIPMKKGSRHFCWENSGIQNHSVLYVLESLDGPSRVVLDPNAMDKQGFYSVQNTSISHDGKYVAYCLSEKGSDWTCIRIRDVDCGHDLEDNLRFIKLSGIVWTKDNQGFFYQRYPPPLNGYEKPTGTEISPNKNAKLHYHKLGSYQDDDIVVAEFPKFPEWTMYSEISNDGNYLFVYASDIIGERYLFYIDTSQGITERPKLHPVFKNRGLHWYLANNGSMAYFVTDIGSNTCKVVCVDLNHPGESNWEVIVPPDPMEIHWAMVVDQTKLVICYLNNVLSQIQIRELESGKIVEEKLELEEGTASQHYGSRGDKEFYVFVESYVNPGILYKVQIEEKTVEVHKKLEFNGVDLSSFVMEPNMCSSNDGTNVPLFAIHKKSIKLDGTQPCLLTAYGGYGYYKLPLFNPSFILFANRYNGVVAIANIRGGREFGKQWWHNGRGENKQNCIDDLITASRYLKNNNYTNTALLAVEGVSNGGLVVAAAVNQRPELYGAAIPQAGIMDMLRFPKFTVGALWKGEFGNPDVYEDLQNLIQYSPLHNIRLPSSGIQYPAILATTSDNDDRVVPSHSYKYIAELQHTIGSSVDQQAQKPILLRVDNDVGHVLGKPVWKWIDERADIYTFLELALNFKPTGAK